MQLIDRENKVPVFSPNDIAPFDLEFLEMNWIFVLVVLRMWMIR